MLNFKHQFISIIFLLTLVITNPAYSQTRLRIVDQNNTPLPNAVIEYSTNPATQQPADEQIYIMDQINKQFAPHVLIVPENSLVSFPNSDDIRHHVYSFSSAKKFELKLYAGKPKSPLRFDKRGLVVMGCNIHDSMVGYIYVSANNNTFKSDEQGVVLLKRDLAPKTRLQVWHPNNTLGLSKHTEFTIDRSMLNQSEIILMMNVNKPEARDSFEDLHFHED